MKNNMKSVRMSDETLETVMSWRGEGFNEKFENLVCDFARGRDQMVHEAELLQVHIGEKRDEMRRVQQRLMKMRDLEPKTAALVNAVVALMEVK